MTSSQRKALHELRRKGYAVIVWTPEELGEAVSPKWVEGMAIQYGWDYLIPEQTEEIQ